MPEFTAASFWRGNFMRLAAALDEVNPVRETVVAETEPFGGVRWALTSRRTRGVLGTLDL